MPGALEDAVTDNKIIRNMRDELEAGIENARILDKFREKGASLTLALFDVRGTSIRQFDRRRLLIIDVFDI